MASSRRVRTALYCFALAILSVTLCTACGPKDGNYSLTAGTELDDATLKAKTIEYGDAEVTPLEYLSCSDPDVTITTEDVIDTSEVGIQKVNVVMEKGFFSREEQVKFHVKDTTPPEIELSQTEVEVELGEDLDLSSYVASVTDPVDGELAPAKEEPKAEGTHTGEEDIYDEGFYLEPSEIDTSQAGTFSPEIVAYDKYGNETTATINVTVTDPLEGVTLKPKNENLEYSKKTTDPTKLVECSIKDAKVTAKKLDLSKTGKRKVTYTVTKGKSKHEVDVTFNVRDTKKPSITLKSNDITVDWGASFDPYSNIDSVKDEVDGEFERVDAEPKENGNGWYTITGDFDTNKSSKYFFTVTACDNHGNKSTKEFSLLVNEKPAPEQPAEAASAQAQQDNAHDYVLNTNTYKFHYPSCRDLSRMNAGNRSDVHMTRDDVIAMGYSPCGHCHP